MSVGSLLVETSLKKNNPSFLALFSIFDCILLVIYQLYDNVEQEQSEVTYFDAFFQNLWRIYTLAICLMLRFPDSSFKCVTSYELQKLRIMTHDPRCWPLFLVQQMQYFNAIVGYKAFKLQTKILQRLKVSLKCMDGYGIWFYATATLTYLQDDTKWPDIIIKEFGFYLRSG